MTQEEKELLLKDLCGRLPYGVRIKLNGRRETSKLTIDWLYTYSRHIEDIKPYLRSLSSMTEEEENEYQDIVQNDGNWVNLLSQNLIDFFNRYHFDYRGLIEKGLALEATENMYTKTE